jgi:hypothetical protein
MMPSFPAALHRRQSEAAHVVRIDAGLANTRTNGTEPRLPCEAMYIRRVSVASHVRPLRAIPGRPPSCYASGRGTEVSLLLLFRVPPRRRSSTTGGLPSYGQREIALCNAVSPHPRAVESATAPSNRLTTSSWPCSHASCLGATPLPVLDPSAPAFKRSVIVSAMPLDTACSGVAPSQVFAPTSTSELPARAPFLDCHVSARPWLWRPRPRAVVRSAHARKGCDYQRRLPVRIRNIHTGPERAQSCGQPGMQLHRSADHQTPSIRHLRFASAFPASTFASEPSPVPPPRLAAQADHPRELFALATLRRQRLGDPILPEGPIRQCESFLLSELEAQLNSPFYARLIRRQRRSQ